MFSSATPDYGVTGSAPMGMPASANQTRYVKAELADRGTYMIAVGHLVSAPLDEDRFRAAVDALVVRHPALRSRFDLIDGTVLVHVEPNAHYRCQVTQLADTSLEAFRTWALPLALADVDPLEPGSLIRVFAADYGDRWRFTIVGHHAITDGLSRGVMNKDLLKLYAGEELQPVTSYYDHTLAEALSDDIRDQAVSMAQALPMPSRIVPDAITDQKDAVTGQFLTHDMGPIQRQLNKTAKTIGTTKFGFLASVYALGLRGLMGTDAVSTFFQSAGRQSLDAPTSVVGSFSNTLPLDLTVDPDQPFASFALTNKERSQSAIALENTQLLDHVLESGVAPSVSINLFPREAPIRAADLKIGPREFLDRQTEFDLNLMWAEDKDGLKARAFYNGARLSDARIKLFLATQERILRAALDTPEATCAEIIAAARADHEAVLPIKTSSPAPARRLHSRFFQQAAGTPDAVAIIQSDGRKSYGTLAARALDIARGLSAAGVKESDRVAIFAQRTPEMVAAMLGVSAYGCSFALIDCTYPTVRITRMLEAIETPFIIEAGARLPDDITTDLIKIHPTDGPAFIPKDGPPRAEACVLFTSGTTGQPKMISHPDRAILRFLDWQVRTLDLNAPMVTCMMAGLGHDPTLRDVFLPYQTKGAIALPSAQQMSEPCTLRDLIRDAGCNVLRLSASTGRLLATGITENESFPKLKAIFWGGERLPTSSVSQWRGYAANTRQFNVFGTTETPQAFLIQEVTEAPPSGNLPIGQPLPYTGARIVDTDGTPVAIGEVGELVADLSDTIGGTYHPHTDQPAREPNTHYTGDLAFQMADGAVRYVGRRDTQIKINGFRVELGEIEATAEAVSGVKRATAIADENLIRLFVIGHSDTVTDRGLRGALAQSLPSYMVPHEISVLDSFPFTPNGKIDHDALRALGSQTTPEIPPEDQPQLSPQEVLIATVFAQTTNRGPVQRHHALADLGADSLATIEARLALEQRGISLPDGWAWMPMAELAIHLPADAAHSAVVPQTGTQRVDMFILLRCIAILSVVAFHSGFQLVGGASIMLFVLAGYGFTQLQLPGILRDRHAGRVWALLLRLLIPLIPISLLYVAFNTYTGATTHPSSLLFYRNLVDLGGALWTGQIGEVEGLEWLWFLHAYLQVFLLLGLLLSVPAVRKSLASNPWAGLLVLFAVSEVISILALGTTTQIIGNADAAATLLFRSPTTLIPFIALGGLVATARGQSQILMSFALVLVHYGVELLTFPTHNEPWWILALVLCAVVPAISLPKVAAVGVVQIAAASLIIYLTHSLVLDSIKWVMGTSSIVRALSIIAQLVVGVSAAIALRHLMARLRLDRGVSDISQSATGGTISSKEKNHAAI